MEIEVTTIVNDHDCQQYQDSIFNSGLQNIGVITWNNAMEAVADESLVTTDQQQDLRDWLGTFGAWDAAEMAAMSDAETNAILLQEVASNVLEMEAYESPAEYLADESVGGHLYPDDSGKWWFYVGE